MTEPITDKVSIHRADDAVYVNNEGLPVDCSQVPPEVRAIQWYGGATPPWGEHEYVPDNQGNWRSNERFSDFTPYAYLVDAWRIAKAEAEAEAERLRNAKSPNSGQGRKLPAA